MKKLFGFLVFLPTIIATIIGEPKIRCAPTGITIMMETDTPFKGSLFLKGSKDRKSCKADFSGQPSQNISFEFSFDECPNRRKRQIAPPRGMTMSSTLIVSYHGSIITHRDVAYQIDCFYREQGHSLVQTLMNVTDQKPKVLSDEPKLPNCDYRVEITRGGVVTSSLAEGNSPVTTVGEAVVHVWTCSGDAPTDIYCMQVHDCFADDGDTDHFQVVDSNGCTTDGDLLSPIKYKNGSMRAAASSKVFKFADKEMVYFKCSIRMKVKSPGDECPVNNCLPEGSVISRHTRDLSVFTSPLTIFRRKTSENTEFNLLVSAGELIVEAQNTKNHLMSTYKPEKYKYSTVEAQMDAKSAKIREIFGIFLTFLIFLF